MRAGCNPAGARRKMREIQRHSGTAETDRNAAEADRNAAETDRNAAGDRDKMQEIDGKTNGPELIWPEGRRIAVLLTFDFDAEFLRSSRAALKGKKIGFTDYSRGQYGPHEGLRRCLDLLDQHGLKATFFVPGAVIETYRECAEEIHRRGHEIACHGYMHESDPHLTPEEEIRIFEKAETLIEEITGRKPAGHRAPESMLRPFTPKLLYERGYLYSSSMKDCDWPYLWDLRMPEKCGWDAYLGDGCKADFQTGQTDDGGEVPAQGRAASGQGKGTPGQGSFGQRRPLVELPSDVMMDDFTYYYFTFSDPAVRAMYRPREVVDAWKAEFDALAAEGNKLFVLKLHPQMSGRLARIRALSELISYMKQNNAWFATCEEAAHYVLRQYGAE